MEVLVVDDGSVEGECDFAQAMAGECVRVLKRTDGLKGPSRCRNLGAAAAKGDYLVFVDADDILASWCLTQRMEAMAQHSDSGFWVFPVLLFKRQPGDLSICWNRWQGDDDLNRFLSSDPPWHTSSPIWSKAVSTAIGGFNERVLYGDDAELHTKASQGSKDIWEGQYFVEGEELLFNVDGSKGAIQEVISAWITTFQPAIFRRQAVRAYFNWDSLCRNHAFLSLRIARRIAMVALPKQFFPAGGKFHQWQVNDEVLGEIRDRIQRPTINTAVARPNL